MFEPEELKRWERLTAAMIRKASQDDPEAFAAVVRILDDAQASLPTACNTLRYPDGGDDLPARATYSWQQLATALGVTRSAAYQRFNLAKAPGKVIS